MSPPVAQPKLDELALATASAFDLVADQCRESAKAARLLRAIMKDGATADYVRSSAECHDTMAGMLRCAARLARTLTVVTDERSRSALFREIHRSFGEAVPK